MELHPLTPPPLLLSRSPLRTPTKIPNPNTKTSQQNIQHHNHHTYHIIITFTFTSSGKAIHQPLYIRQVHKTTEIWIHPFTVSPSCPNQGEQLGQGELLFTPLYTNTISCSDKKKILHPLTSGHSF